MQFGDRLKQQRKNKNLTQDDVAAKLNVSRQTISSWENEKSYPDIKSLTVLSDMYDISLDTMLKEDSGMKEFIEKSDLRKNLVGLRCATYSFDIIIVLLNLISFHHHVFTDNYQIILSILTLSFVLIMNSFSKFTEKMGFKKFNIFQEVFHVNKTGEIIFDIILIAMYTLSFVINNLIPGILISVFFEIVIIIYYFRNK
ncbi:helix-turn-helix domain-containing protein [Apilactobacillus nanyangensis]|uniref:Helix-turn-helix domain-containing protein n=1 Tax=Apilactobacillus nanyangensis TaxID=2799579 RepID=A0ABT0HZ25_9LACO|nr:helix-turn-helix transcriptional regulator [Apilactobacillus nanyangensis]MCK8611589.1 helix-turn-helix domain-containing protein [Apilactobacillus nanyangensis]